MFSDLLWKFVSNLSLAGLKLAGLSWNDWSDAMAVQCELECLI